MPYLILFDDAKDAPADLRARHMAAHLAFLERNARQITAAGPLFDDETGVGGAWIVDAPDRAAVETLIKADPFWPTGLRDQIRILRWAQVFADGRRLIDPT